MVVGFSGNVFAVDNSDLGSPLFKRMEEGCEK